VPGFAFFFARASVLIGLLKVFAIGGSFQSSLHVLDRLIGCGQQAGDPLLLFRPSD
jgi:hypothetical protein